MIWFADLDQTGEDPYTKPVPNGITADDVARIQGEVASPAQLKKQLDELKTELDKKFHGAEQTRLFNRGLVMLLLGIAVTIGVALFKQYVDVLKDQKRAPPAQKTVEEEPAPEKKTDK
jgi:hypothetical protein